jgi:hypothetical protein
MGVITLVVTGKVDTGLVGVVLSYGLSTTGSLVISFILDLVCSRPLTVSPHPQNYVVRSASEVEQNIVSVERIVQYIGLQSEAPAEVPENRPPSSWPQRGAIIFRYIVYVFYFILWFFFLPPLFSRGGVSFLRFVLLLVLRLWSLTMFNVVSFFAFSSGQPPGTGKTKTIIEAVRLLKVSFLRKNSVD